MKKIIVSLLALVLALSVLLTGCGKKPAPAPAATTGGTVVIAQESEPGNLNPLIWATTSDTNLTHMMYDSLVIPDEKLKMVGSLAETWDVSADGKVYTFHLKQGVKWHDGQPFTAKDVAFTYTSLADAKYDMGANARVESVVGSDEYKAGKATSVSGIKVVDDNTIEFTLKKANAAFISDLFIGILPEHILKGVSPAEWAKHPSNRAPIGTGPFKFVKWEPGQYLEVAANKDYFKGAPKLDKIITRFGDANTMLAAFINKEVNIVPVPIAEVPSIKSSDFVNIKLQNQLSVYYIGFNLKNENFKDVKVRQALAYGINKKLIVDSVLGEYGNTSDDVFPTNHWSHSPNVTSYAYNIEKAKQLLEEAGYKLNANKIYAKNGKELSIKINVPTGKKEREKTAVLVKQNFDELGIKCELISLDFPTLVTKILPKAKDGKQRAVTAADFDAFILGYGVEADPNEYVTYFDTKNMPPNGYNFCGTSDPELDKMLESQNSEPNFEARQKLFWAIGEKISQLQPWIPIYEQNLVFGANKNVSGFEPDFRGVTFNARLWELKK